MRSRLALTLAVIVAMAVVITPAYSQSIPVKADIPFAFRASGYEMPAGAYTLRHHDGVILWQNSKQSYMTLAGTAAEGKDSSRVCLVFRVYGDRYILGSIWVGQVGREFPKSKLETELAQASKPKEVAILLYPVR